jgi:ABC-type uncharacterized transport system permease subunit
MTLDSSVVWLRAAVVLYSFGLAYALLTLAHKRREELFRFALGAFYTGTVLHLVSLVEHFLLARHFSTSDFYESASLCAFLVALLFLIAYWRYRYESLAVFVFPLVFLLALVGELGSPVSPWSDPRVRNVWLMVHVVLVLIGYAAMAFTAVASVMYLIRERQLKSKKTGSVTNRLPPLGALDALISRALSLGFIFVTLAVVAGSTWASIESGTRWVRDPRVVISLFTWALYLVVVFVRMAAGWRGRKAAIMVLALVGCSALTWATHTGLRNLFTQ